ncbi:MAG TPA: carboxylesterase family protein, partial [Clostridiales bacterium]|nr:carboxylesterase family protein [Clostridiales bacterium]
MLNKVSVTTSCGALCGIDRGSYAEFRGIPYASASRWEYPVITTHWDGELDATRFGACCDQHRAFEEDRKVNPFYSKEFRRGCSFTYSEHCQFLNLYVPKNAKDAPILLYIHGGSFTGGSADENHISGVAYAERGVLFAAINYRLGPYGFCSHPALTDEEGRCGNYGLYDQVAALKWIQENISAFGGDPKRITLMGQSAGAMSVDILLSSPLCKDLISGAVLMSGAALERALSHPLSPEKMQPFWELIMKQAGVNTMAELKKTDEKVLYYAWKKACKETGLKSMTSYTFPCIDGALITEDSFSMRTISAMPKIIGMTSGDMFPIVLKALIRAWGRRDKNSRCYVYLFNRDLPGDKCGAWHSCDLLYAFGTLRKNWRPFTKTDDKISEKMIYALTAFVKTGDPNCKAIPRWKPGTKKIMVFGKHTRMRAWPNGKLCKNTVFMKGP